MSPFRTALRLRLGWAENPGMAGEHSSSTGVQGPASKLIDDAAFHTLRRPIPSPAASGGKGVHGKRAA
jgi:hypothetical protein